MPKKLAVFSHHRSGTHFLMKSLALNSSYIDDPEISLDVNLGFDLWNPHSFADLVGQFREKQVSNIIKCHYEVDFIAPVIDKFLDDFHLIYILRKPEDALKSYFEYSKKLQWTEAPDTATVSAFVRAAPIGSSLRWQYRQYESMAHRWVGHIGGWLNMAKLRPQIILVTYEDLRDRYQDTMTYIAGRLGWDYQAAYHTPPSTGIFPGQAGDYAGMYDPDVLDWMRSFTSPIYQEASEFAKIRTVS